jgi:hypothetical protein
MLLFPLDESEEGVCAVGERIKKRPTVSVSRFAYFLVGVSPWVRRLLALQRLVRAKPRVCTEGAERGSRGELCGHDVRVC